MKGLYCWFIAIIFIGFTINSANAIDKPEEVAIEFSSDIKLLKDDPNAIKENHSELLSTDNPIGKKPKQDRKTIPGYLIGGWGADIQAWNEQESAAKVKFRKKRLSEIKKQCRAYWNNPIKINCNANKSSGLVLTSTYVSARGMAENRCRKNNQFQNNRDISRYNDCVYETTMEIEEQRAIRAERDDRRIRRQKAKAKRYCIKTRDYCANAESFVAQGILPRQKSPQWSSIDEKKIKELSSTIVLDLQEVESKALAHKKNMQQAIEESEDSKAENIERRKQLARESALRRETHDKWCQIEIALGHSPCGCKVQFSTCDK